MNNNISTNQTSRVRPIFGYFLRVPVVVINTARQILNYLARTHRWIGHVFTEGRMKGKATRGS